MCSRLINEQVVLASRPKEMADLSNFAFIQTPVPPLGNGEVLIQTLYLSVDPYMRGRMGGRPSSHPPFELNQCLTGQVIGRVINSNSPHFEKGSIVKGRLGWANYSVAKDMEIEKLNLDGLPLTTSLGLLGSPGMTAYFGLLDIGQPKEGETVVVTSAAGAVGLVVGQIAKIMGCRVVGITGSEAKVNFLTNRIGFDAAINYKENNFEKILRGHLANSGIDIYFDNVGGVITDHVLCHINKYARIVLCGQISTYNDNEPEKGIRHFRTLIVNSALAKGLIVWDYKERYREAILNITEWIKEGKIKNQETITEGLENAPKAFLGLFKGKNIGKQIVKISD